VDQCLAVFDAVAAGDVGAQSPAAYGARDVRALLDAAARGAPRRRRAAAALVAEMGGDARDAPPARRGRVGAVALAGESAGACIAASVAERVAARSAAARGGGARPARPAALLIYYPPLNLHELQSPSRIVMAFDPLLPINALVAASQAYGSLDMDESVMSYYSDAAILCEFPKTLIICGGTDPLLDDAVDFHTRLRRAGVDASLVVHRKLTHGFLGMLPYGPLAPPHALELAELGVRFLADGLAGAGDARRG